MQRIILFSGLPGSGKSTLAELLSRELRVALFAVDPIEAAMWRGGLAKGQTGIAAYEVAVTLADEHLRLGHCVIVDAVNPVEAARAAWRDLAAKHHHIGGRARETACRCAELPGCANPDAVGLIAANRAQALISLL